MPNDKELILAEVEQELKKESAEKDFKEGRISRREFSQIMLAMGATAGLSAIAPAANAWTGARMRKTSQVPVLNSYTYTPILLKTNGVANSQNSTFIDSSTNALTVTRSGNVSQGSFSPFSPAGWCGHFHSPTTDCLTFPASTGNALHLGSNNFTIEFWFRPVAFGNYYSLFNWNAAAGGYSSLYLTLTTTGALSLNASQNGSSWLFGGALTGAGTAVTLGSWNHVAVVRSGTTVKLYLNGNLESSNSFSITGSFMSTYTQNYIGAYNSTTTYNFHGMISNFRIVMGTALYTSNFTVPTATLTAVTNTALLVLQDHRFKDSSTNNYAVTLAGTPAIQAQSPFVSTATYSAATHGGSYYFDGTGDYLSIPDNAGLNMLASNFTIELWFYPIALPSGSVQLFAKRANNATYSGVGIYFVSASLSPSLLGTTTGTTWEIQINSSIACKRNSWNHIALTRSGDLYSVWVNGQLGVSSTIAGTISTNANNLTLGAGGADGSSVLQNCYCSDFRVVKGTAIYTAAFTPPTAPLTAVTNTQLLIKGQNAGIFDQSARVDLETLSNAKVNTTTTKYSANAAFDGGATCYLKFPAGTQWNISTGVFTIEMWYYKTAQAGTYGRLFQTVDGDTVCTLSLYDNAGNLGWAMSSNGSSQDIVNNGSVAALALTTWYHIAVVRYGDSINLYLNGTSVASVSTSAVLMFNIAHAPIIGGQSSPARSITGYIEDFRYSRGIAQYKTNFTPPAAAF